MTIALLVAVPSRHLASAAEQGMSTIALGTRAWDTLEQFERVAGSGALVFVYASHDDGVRRPVATWAGECGDYRVAVGNGAVPKELMAFRPRTMACEDREAGHWFGYFTVTDLTRLDEAKPLSELRQWSGDRLLSPAFVPHGPLIVVV